MSATVAIVIIASMFFFVVWFGLLCHHYRQKGLINRGFYDQKTARIRRQ